jgi:hypothetical protein
VAMKSWIHPRDMTFFPAVRMLTHFQDTLIMVLIEYTERVGRICKKGLGVGTSLVRPNRLKGECRQKGLKGECSSVPVQPTQRCSHVPEVTPRQSNGVKGHRGCWGPLGGWPHKA